jgi:hypothetical protein
MLWNQENGSKKGSEESRQEESQIINLQESALMAVDSRH